MDSRREEFYKNLIIDEEDKERADEMIPPTVLDIVALFEEKEGEKIPDFADIRGQEMVKRAAVIAAAGFHHLLITGVPGAGKTMIPMSVTLGAWCILRIVYIEGLVRVIPNINVVFSAYPVTWMVSSTLLLCS